MENIRKSEVFLIFDDNSLLMFSDGGWGGHRKGPVAGNGLKTLKHISGSGHFLNLESFEWSFASN